MRKSRKWLAFMMTFVIFSFSFCVFGVESKASGAEFVETITIDNFSNLACQKTVAYDVGGNTNTIKQDGEINYIDFNNGDTCYFEVDLMLPLWNWNGNAGVTCRGDVVKMRSDYRGIVGLSCSGSSVSPNFTVVSTRLQFGNQFSTVGSSNALYGVFDASNYVGHALNDAFSLRVGVLMSYSSKVESTGTLTLKFAPNSPIYLDVYNADSIEDILTEQDNADKNAMDSFSSNSGTQSGTIDDLNQQSKVDKIDVNSASNTIDGYIDSNAIGNYGVLLSTFTTNEHVLQLMLAVLAIGLVSYVLFGKR